MFVVVGNIGRQDGITQHMNIVELIDESRKIINVLKRGWPISF